MFKRINDDFNIGLYIKMLFLFFSGIAFVAGIIPRNPLGLNPETRQLFTTIVVSIVAIQVEMLASQIDRVKNEKKLLFQIESILSKTESLYNINVGVKCLGNIREAMPEVAKIFQESRVIRDTTFRTPGCDHRIPHPHALKIYVDAFHKNIQEMDSYELIVCDETLDYYKNFYPDIDKFPPNFNVYKLDVKIPYPNFLISHSKSKGQNVVVIGWPYDNGALEDVFIVYDQKIVKYFDGIFTRLMPPASSSVRIKTKDNLFTN